MFSFPVHAEAAIAVGELAEAEELLDWIEERAVRLDREWALACAARCRGLLAAARGDEAGADTAFERSLAEHAARSVPAVRPRADAAGAGRIPTTIQAQAAGAGINRGRDARSSTSSAPSSGQQGAARAGPDQRPPAPPRA